MTLKFKCVFSLAMLSLLFFSCSEERDFIEKNSKNKYSFKQYNWNEANKIIKFKEAFSKVNNTFKKKNSETSKSEMFGFEVDDNIVKEISTEDYTSYNMLIVREEQSSEYFENLVIEIVNDTTTNAYLVKYTPTLDTQTSDDTQHMDFVGTIETYKVHGQTCITCTNDDGSTGGYETGGTVCTIIYKCFILILQIKISLFRIFQILVSVNKWLSCHVMVLQPLLVVVLDITQILDQETED